MRTGYLITLLLASVGASPVAEPATTAAAAFCSVVTAVVTKAKAQVPATAYCSSFLGIKTSTIRKTVPLTSTETKVLYVPTSTSTATEFITTTETSTTYFQPTCQPALTKRAVAKPACFNAYTVATAISSACKCLSIPTPSTTTTITAGVTTVTSTQTVNVLASTTVTSTNTVTEQASATSADFILRAQGGVGNYAQRFFTGGRPDAVSVRLNRPRPAGTTFTFNDQCGIKVTNDGYQEYTAYGLADNRVVLLDPNSTPDQGYEEMTCTTPGDNRVVCSVPSGASVNNACPLNGQLAWFLSTGPMEGCSQFTFTQESE